MASSKSSSRSSVFERLSKTETYASRRLKEQVEKPKESGRPLFVKQIVTAQLGYKGKSNYISKLKISHSSSTTTTCSSSSSRSTSVFDRLASTGTKSSLCKSKKSETFGESVKNFNYRTYDKGCKTVFAKR